MGAALSDTALSTLHHLTLHHLTLHHLTLHLACDASVRQARCSQKVLPNPDFA